MNKCKTCRFFRSEEGNICVCHAPKFNVETRLPNRCWPSVNISMWCGDWEAQKHEEPDCSNCKYWSRFSFIGIPCTDGNCCLYYTCNIMTKFHDDKEKKRHPITYEDELCEGHKPK